jgi:uncharacterized protein (DUF1330 family)
MTVSAMPKREACRSRAYHRYQTEFLGAFAQVNGPSLFADKCSEVVEGQTGVDKVSLVSFPDRATFTTPVKSSDYTIAFRVGGYPMRLSEPVHAQ